MYKNGDIVTLAIDKSHGEGEDAVRLNSGTCGMIVQAKRDSNKENIYVVDFGAYGQWYCIQSELNGDDSESWEEPEEERNQEQPSEGSPEPGISILDSLNEPYNANQDKLTPIVNVEADIRKRVKELEKGYD